MSSLGARHRRRRRVGFAALTGCKRHWSAWEIRTCCGNSSAITKAHHRPPPIRSIPKFCRLDRLCRHKLFLTFFFLYQSLMSSNHYPCRQSRQSRQTRATAACLSRLSTLSIGVDVHGCMRRAMPCTHCRQGTSNLWRSLPQDRTFSQIFSRGS